MTQIVKCARFSGIDSALVIANERFQVICYDGRKIIALPKARRQRQDTEMSDKEGINKLIVHGIRKRATVFLLCANNSLVTGCRQRP